MRFSLGITPPRCDWGSAYVEGSVIHDSLKARDHVMRMIDAAGIVSRQGQVLPTAFHSICVHGDGPAALKTARAVTDALLHHGHQVEPLDRLFDWPWIPGIVAIAIAAMIIVWIGQMPQAER